MSGWRKAVTGGARRLQGVLSVDLRSLALFRVALGAALLADLAGRLRDLEVHYTDAGLLPRVPYLDKLASVHHWSLHLASGKPGWQLLLFGLAAVFALLLMAGWRTRLVTVVSWVLLVSLQNRNPVILSAGDSLLRMLVFWGMFLPLGARWSMDAAMRLRGPGSNEPLREGPSFFGAGSVGITAQLVFVYLFTAVLKSGREWFPDGTASYYALSLDMFVTGFGAWLSQFHGLLRVSTYAVLALEYLAPVLILWPFFNAPLRLLTLAALAFMHLNFELTMNIGLFPYFDIVLLLALVPGAFWDFWARHLTTPERRGLSIHYDGDCGFCRRMALLVRTFLLLDDANVVPAQDEPELAEILARENSWVVRDGQGGIHLRSAALIVLLEHSPLTGWAARRLPLRRLVAAGDRVYGRVAARRDVLGWVAAAFLPLRHRPVAVARWYGQVFPSAALLYVLVWNLGTLPGALVKMPASIKPYGLAFRLDQKWSMFAPFPLKADGWFVMPGKLADGSEVDLFRGGAPVSWDKPHRISATFPNDRWRKYLSNINGKRHRGHRAHYARYLCREWNSAASGDRKLQTFELVFMKEKTPPPGGELKVEKVSFWRHDCFRKSPASEPSVSME